MQTTLLHGDCLEVLPTLDAQSMDACVTDPPYGLAFMGKDWDHGVPGEHFWREVLRVLKPGAHLLAFGGTRTFHRLTCAIEDAGFEIRDCLMWLYGSGFPKSLDVSKAMDKAAGAEREVVGTRQLSGYGKGNVANGQQNRYTTEFPETSSTPATDLARQWQGWGTALKPAWEPIILARKPLIGTVAANVEQYGTGAVNVDGCRVGTEPVTSLKGLGQNRNLNDDNWSGIGSRPEPTVSIGRWPANLILDEEAAAMLDEQSGTLTSGANPTRRGGLGYHGADGQLECAANRGIDSGGASRFFFQVKGDDSCDVNTAGPSSCQRSERGASAPSGAATSEVRAGQRSATGQPRTADCTEGFTCSTQTPSHAPSAERQGSTGTIPTTQSPTTSCGSVLDAIDAHTRAVAEGRAAEGSGPESVTRFLYSAKASRSERNAGLEGMEERVYAPSGGAQGAAARGEGYDEGQGIGLNRVSLRQNHHPTVKPLALMRYLCRLVTPPGGTVLDPFTGSGSTGCAAVLEGFGFTGIEQDAEYVEIAGRRVEHWQQRADRETAQGALI